MQFSNIPDGEMSNIDIAVRELRIIGPPGTGKTTYLSRQVAVAASKYGGKNVRAASLTRTAAAEISRRVNSVPRSNVGTLHSHAYHLLDCPDIFIGKIVIEWNEHIKKAGKPHLQLTVASGASENDKSDFFTHETIGDEYYNEISLLRSRMIPSRLWKQKLISFYNKITAWKTEHEVLDFQDMIAMCIDREMLLPGKAFFLDEAQDMDLLEMSLARMWAKTMQVFIVVGDPDQNLYQWRGSDPNVFTTPKLPDDCYRILSQSYRVPVVIHSYAVNWIEKIKNRKKAPYYPTQTRGAVHRWRQGNYKFPKPIIDEAVEYAKHGQTSMILASCSYMLEDAKRYMKLQGIPFYNPYRRKRGDWNPVNNIAKRLHSYLKTTETDDLWTAKELYEWAELLRAKDYLNRGAKKEMAEFSKGDFSENKTTLHILNILFKENYFPALHGNIDWLNKAVLPKYKKMLSYPEQVYKRAGNRYVLNARPKIILGTIHSVKGGEADNVFVFPDLSMQAMEGYIKSPDPVTRLFYVAFTRAKNKLYLCNECSGARVKWM